MVTSYLPGRSHTANPDRGRGREVYPSHGVKHGYPECCFRTVIECAAPRRLRVNASGGAEADQGNDDHATHPRQSILLNGRFNADWS